MSRLLLVADAALVPPEPLPGTTIVVLDTAWTPMPDGRGDVVAVRAFVRPVLDRVDLFAESLRLLDAWAAEAGLPHNLAIGGFSAWYATREELWSWLHERLLWRLVIGDLVERFGANHLAITDDGAALAEVALALRAAGLAVTVGEASPVVAGPVTGPAPAPTPGSSAIPGSAAASLQVAPTARRRAGVQLPRRLLRRLGIAPGAPNGATPSGGGGLAAHRLEILGRRVAMLAAEPGPRVLVLSYALVHQQVGEHLTDPNLGSVIERLRRDGPAPVVLGLGLSHRDDAAWPAIEADEQLLPGSLVGSRWGGPDAAPAEAEALLHGAFDRALATPLLVDGVDLGPPPTARLMAGVRAWLPAALMLRRRVGRLLAELRPDAILLTHEGIRAPWLVAAREAGIPTLAVQHGMLYPSHPGYCRPRDPSITLPDRTLVYGPYERDVLIRHGGYRPDEVEVTGSPRTDLDPAPDRGRGAPEGAVVRAGLGVRDDHRLLVVSTAHVPLFRHFYLANMLERTLGGPLPGVHVVVKQHPGEQDEGPYRRLLDGLARAGGHEAAPMTIVRETDLYRLLRAADAHLGLHSTVFTDAVYTGTPNLVAIVGAFRDPLGWVDAGVGRPVHDVADVRVALAEPQHPDAAARRAFLAAHFLDGDAGSRIVAAIWRVL